MIQTRPGFQVPTILSTLQAKYLLRLKQHTVVLLQTVTNNPPTLLFSQSPQSSPVGAVPHETLQPATPTPGESSATQELPKTPPSPLPQIGLTPRSGKLSSWQEHSISPIAGKAHLSRFRQQECQEMDPKSAEIPVDKFALYFLPGTDPTPQELGCFDEFNPAMFAFVDNDRTVDNPEKRMYAEIV